MPLTAWDIILALPRGLAAGAEVLGIAAREATGNINVPGAVAEWLDPAGVYPYPASRGEGANIEIQVSPELWLPLDSRGAQIVINRAGTRKPSYAAGEVDVMARYGRVSAWQEPPGVLSPLQPYIPVVGPSSAIIGAKWAAEAVLDAEEGAHLAEQTALYAQPPEAAMAEFYDPLVGTLTTKPLPGFEDPRYQLYPEGGAMEDPTLAARAREAAEAVASRAVSISGVEAVTGGTLLAGLTALGGYLTGRAAPGGDGASTLTGATMGAIGHPHSRHHKVDIAKAAMTAAMLRAGMIPMPMGTTAKNPRKWFHPPSGKTITLPKKRRGRGITAGDVKTVRRVHGKFRTVAKSLGYAFSEGGRGKVSAKSGHFTKKRKR